MLSFSHQRAVCVITPSLTWWPLWFSRWGHPATVKITEMIPDTLTTTLWCVCVCRGRQRTLVNTHTHTSRLNIKIYLTCGQYVGREMWAHLSSHLSGWSRRERDCTTGDVQEEQIKSYQRNPVIARQLIVSPGTEQRHFFCLLIRLRSCWAVACLCARG